jgi:hypothetical protein
VTLPSVILGSYFLLNVKSTCVYSECLTTTMQYALDTNGSWANAKLTEYKKHSQFFCGCAERHNVKLVKPSGVLGKRPFSDYFAHITKSLGEHEHHAGRGTGCISAESLSHFNAKHRLREMVGHYAFTTFRCITCHKRRVTYSRGCEVIVEEPSKDRKWRYDCLLRRNGNDVAALEVLHSHKVTGEKASSVRGSGLEIAEFRAEDVLNLLAVRPTNHVHLENLLVQLGTCQQCVTAEDLRWMRVCWYDEVWELRNQERQMDSLYHQDASDKELHKELLVCRQRCLIEKGVVWHLSCWRDELQELVAQETKLASDYRDAVRYKKLLTRQTVLEKYRRLHMTTHRSRRLRLYAQRATRWMARYARTLRE